MKTIVTTIALSTLLVGPALSDSLLGTDGNKTYFSIVEKQQRGTYTREVSSTFDGKTAFKKSKKKKK